MGEEEWWCASSRRVVVCDDTPGPSAHYVRCGYLGLIPFFVFDEAPSP